MALWAAAFPAITVAVRHVDPFELAAVRFGLAATVMGAWLLWQRAWPRSTWDFARILLCGFLGIALYNVLLNTGQRTVPPGAASFLIATQPIFSAVWAHLLREQRIGLTGVIGSAVSLLGVAAIAVSQGSDLAPGAGAFLVLSAAFCSGTYFVLQRPLVITYGAMTSAAWTIVVGALLLTPWLPAGLVRAAESDEAILAIGFLGLGAGVLGYVCWTAALADLGSARAANLLFLMAPVATLMSLPISGVPTLLTLGGGALTLAGVVIVHFAYRRSYRATTSRATTRRSTPGPQ